jgi:hypothetical protein
MAVLRLSAGTKDGRAVPEHFACAYVLHHGAHEAAASIFQDVFGEDDALVNGARVSEKVRPVVSAAPAVDMEHCGIVGHDGERQ